MLSQKRVLISAVLIVAGVSLALVSSMSIDEGHTSRADGAVIDYGYYETDWVNTDLSDITSEMQLLERVCDLRGLSLTLDQDGSILELGGFTSTTGIRWDIWVIEKDSTDWVRLEAPYTENPSDYTITSISYVKVGEEPTVAVDYSGTPIYGYDVKYRTVTLSPTVTEIVSSVKAVNTIVGVDYYSDYPKEVVDGVSNGSVSTIGTYTSPSFELIMGVKPDMVFCDGTQKSHRLMANHIRNTGIDAVLLYPGEDTDSIRDNIFIAGISMHYDLAAADVIDGMDLILAQLSSIVNAHWVSCPDVMVTLEPDNSPWVSGYGTYIDSMLSSFNSTNVFSERTGWVRLTSELISSANPDVIIIITTEYRATQSDYDLMLDGLSQQWRKTDAWKDGRVYMICEGASEMVQRFGPRTPQVAELICMMLHPECFTGEIPHFIGDNYADYLYLSKNTNYH